LSFPRRINLSRREAPGKLGLAFARGNPSLVNEAEDLKPAACSATRGGSLPRRVVLAGLRFGRLPLSPDSSNLNGIVGSPVTPTIKCPFEARTRLSTFLRALAELPTQWGVAMPQGASRSCG
jgi:hypothetical protein